MSPQLFFVKHCAYNTPLTVLSPFVRLFGDAFVYMRAAVFFSVTFKTYITRVVKHFALLSDADVKTTADKVLFFRKFSVFIVLCDKDGIYNVVTGV